MLKLFLDHIISKARFLFQKFKLLLLSMRWKMRWNQRLVSKLSLLSTNFHLGLSFEWSGRFLSRIGQHSQMLHHHWNTHFWLRPCLMSFKPRCNIEWHGVATKTTIGLLPGLSQVIQLTSCHEYYEDQDAKDTCK